MIQTKIISEIVGSPEEHVNKTMDLLLDKIKERKDIKIKAEKKFEAKKMQDNPLYTAFMEYEAEFEKLEDVTSFCFDFMPSSIEIIKPHEIQMNATVVADLFNELLARLHQNEIFLRNLIAEVQLMKKESKK
ncbi:MAG: hypothetical protein AABX90_01265 [Nanoarchaeota archaeon]